MNPEQIISTLTAHGVHLTRDAAGALRAGPAAAITPELASLIREHRADLLAALAPPPHPLAVREFFDERAAVFEFEAGVTRVEAREEGPELTQRTERASARACRPRELRQ